MRTSKIGSFPQRGENKTYSKPPARKGWDFFGGAEKKGGDFMDSLVFFSFTFSLKHILAGSLLVKCICIYIYIYVNTYACV